MPVSSYCAVGDVTTLIPSIGSATNITSAAIWAYIGDAANEIESKLSQRYAIPLATNSGQTVPMIKTLNVRMAAFDLIVGRALAQFSIADQKGNPFLDRLKSARDILDSLASGEIGLLGSDGVLVNDRLDVMQVWSNTKGYAPTFTEGDMLDNIQDQDKLATDLLTRNIAAT